MYLAPVDHSAFNSMRCAVLETAGYNVCAFQVHLILSVL